ncbi:MAG: type II secretion system protein GspM [Myxococcota bacterium]
MAFGDAFDNVRGWFDTLNQRERRLLGLMGTVLAALVFIVPMYLLVSSIGDIENENAAINGVLQDIQRAEEQLQQRKASRRAMDRLYSRKAPSLGGFLEESAQQFGVSGLSITDQPNVDLQDGEYTRRSVRVSLPRVDLRPLIDMLADIKNSSYPVSIERIQLDGGRRRETYNAKLAVDAYDRASADAGDEQ